MVEFKSKFDKSKLEKADKHVSKKLSWFIIMLIALLVLLAVLAIFDGDVVGTCIYFALAIVLYPLYLCFIKYFEKKLADSMPVMSEETEEIYRFTEGKLSIVQNKGEDFNSVTTASYNYLYKVEKTFDGYFLYISQNQMHVIENYALTEGSIEELDKILSDNLGAKFIVRKK